MSFLKDLFESFLPSLAEGFIGSQGGGGKETSIWPSVITTGGSLLSELFRDPYEGVAYGQTPEGYKEQLAQLLQIEQMKDATDRERIAASLAAAAQAANAQTAAARIGRDSALRQMLMRNQAEALANSLDARKSGMTALQKARENMLSAKMKEAELVSNLYAGAGQSLMGMARR